MRTRILFLAVVLLTLGAHAEDKVGEDAEHWLALVDAERYEESWSESATLFQSQVSNSQWVSALSQVRRPLGAVKSRSLTNRSEHASLPGAPAGSYVVLVYQSEFESKSDAQETVTLALSEGAWRVVGYFIK